MQRGCPDVWNVVYPQETTASKMDVLGEFALCQQGNEGIAQVFDSEDIERNLTSTHSELYPHDVRVNSWAALARQAQLEQFQEC